VSKRGRPRHCSHSDRKRAALSGVLVTSSTQWRPVDSETVISASRSVPHPNAEVFWLIEDKGETGPGVRRQHPVFTEARRHSFNELDLKINSKSEQTRVDGVDASFQRSGGRDVVEFEERRRRTKTVVYVGHATRQQTTTIGVTAAALRRDDHRRTTLTVRNHFSFRTPT